MANNKQIIRVTKGQEHNVRIIEKPQKDALFFDVYVRAKNIAYEIVKESELIKSFNYDPDTIETINNIILFNGSRGQGKTSAMRSFDKMLENKSWEMFEVAQETTLKGTVTFHSLRVIEPSMLNPKESILRVFLSELFWFFKKKIAKNEECMKRTIRDKNDILLQFGQCFDSINFIENPDYGISEQDDLDELLRLGRATELRKDLYNLIKNIKEYCFDNNAHYFVVMIDDADLSVKNAYDICEDVREYLTIPGILVLMAADFEQLKYAVLQKYLKNYEVLIKSQGLYKMPEICSEMEWRYLEKLFPIDHRIQLPEINSLDLSKVRLEYLKFDGKKERNILSEYIGCKDLKQILSRMIFQKTGMIFVSNRATLRALLPKSMRELAHFLKILDSMEGIQYENIYQQYMEEDKTQLERAKKNINIFKQYFVHNWCNANIEASRRKYILELLETKDLKKICAKLESIILPEPKACEPTEKQSSSEKNKDEAESSNQSKDESGMGTIRSILNVMKTRYMIEREAVLILFTILLNESFLQCVEEHSFYELSIIMECFFSEMCKMQTQQEIILHNDSTYQSHISRDIYDRVISNECKSIVDNKLFKAFFKESENEPNGNKQFNIWHMLYYMISLAEDNANVREYYLRDESETEGLGTRDALKMGVQPVDNRRLSVDYRYLLLLQRVFTNTDCLAEKCFTPNEEIGKVSIEMLYEEIHKRFKAFFRIDRSESWSYLDISKDSATDSIEGFIKDITGDKVEFKDSLEAILYLNDANSKKYVEIANTEISSIGDKIEKICDISKKTTTEASLETQKMGTQSVIPTIDRLSNQLDAIGTKDIYSDDDDIKKGLEEISKKKEELQTKIQEINEIFGNAEAGKI